MLPNVYKWRELIGKQMGDWHCWSVGWGDYPENLAIYLLNADEAPVVCRFCYEILERHTLASLCEHIRVVLP